MLSGSSFILPINHILTGCYVFLDNNYKLVGDGFRGGPSNPVAHSRPRPQNLLIPLRMDEIDSEREPASPKSGVEFLQSLTAKVRTYWMPPQITMLEDLPLDEKNSDTIKATMVRTRIITCLLITEDCFLTYL